MWVGGDGYGGLKAGSWYSELYIWVSSGDSIRSIDFATFSTLAVVTDIIDVWCDTARANCLYSNNTFSAESIDFCLRSALVQILWLPFFGFLTGFTPGPAGALVERFFTPVFAHRESRTSVHTSSSSSPTSIKWDVGVMLPEFGLGCVCVGVFACAIWIWFWIIPIKAPTKVG